MVERNRELRSNFAKPENSPAAGSFRDQRTSDQNLFFDWHDFTGNLLPFSGLVRFENQEEKSLQMGYCDIDEKIGKIKWHYKILNEINKKTMDI